MEDRILFFYRAFLVCLCLIFASDIGRADVLQFFPSTSIHEDDSVFGDYDLKVDGCTFEITKFSPNREMPDYVRQSVVDLSAYITLPLVVGSAGGTYTSRVNTIWFVEDHLKQEISSLSFSLQAMSVPALLFSKTRNEDDLDQLRQGLRDRLEKIQAGEFGEFAQKNHSVSYEASEPQKIISVSVGPAFYLPSNGWEAGALIEAVFQHQLTHCPEIIARVLDRLDRVEDGKIDPHFLDALNLEYDPTIKRVTPRNEQ